MVAKSVTKERPSRGAQRWAKEAHVRNQHGAVYRYHDGHAGGIYGVITNVYPRRSG